MSLSDGQQETSEAVSDWLAANSLTLPPDAVEDMAGRLQREPVVTAVTRMDAFRATHEDHFGYSFEDAVNVTRSLDFLEEYVPELAASLRRVLNREDKPEDHQSVQPFGSAVTRNGPPTSSSARVQSGLVFDTVIHDGVAYHRVRDGVVAGTPYSLRLQANRPLTDDEMHQVAGLAGYLLRSTVHGEGCGDPERDSPFSFILGNDTTKGNPEGLSAFEASLDDIVRDGSPVRATDRSGLGTRGTRLVDGIADPTLTFEIYYDDVETF